MKKLFVSLMLCLIITFCFTVSTLFAVEDLFPVGSKVYVVTLEHQDEFLAGKDVPRIKGKIIRYDHKGWTLYSEKLDAEGQSNILPPGYTEWDVLVGQNWPGGKTGMPLKIPVILLDNGATITGDKCWWELTDKTLNDQKKAILNERLVKYISVQVKCWFKNNSKELGLSTAAEVEQFLRDNSDFIEKHARAILNESKKKKK